MSCQQCFLTCAENLHVKECSTAMATTVTKIPDKTFMDKQEKRMLNDGMAVWGRVIRL